MCFTTLYNIILALTIGMAYIAIALLYRLFRNGNLKFSVLFLNVLFTFRDVNILLQQSISCKGVMIEANSGMKCWSKSKVHHVSKGL